MDLWGDDTNPSRRRSLQTLVSRLRSVTGRDGIVVQDDAYSLNVLIDLDVASVLSAATRGVCLLRVDTATGERVCCRSGS